MLRQNVRVQASRSASPPLASSLPVVRSASVDPSSVRGNVFPPNGLRNLCFVMIIFHPRLLNVTHCCCFSDTTPFQCHLLVTSRASLLIYYYYNIIWFRYFDFRIFRHACTSYYNIVQKHSNYFIVIAVFAGHDDDVYMTTIHCVLRHTILLLLLLLLLPLLLRYNDQRRRRPVNVKSFTHVIVGFFFLILCFWVMFVLFVTRTGTLDQL